MEPNEELDALREQVREVTVEILRDVQRRMELARRIGDVKGRLGIEVKDEKVENEIRSAVLNASDEIGMGRDFALRLLSILLAESESVQHEKRAPTNRPTHLEIFVKAKLLESAGNKMIHMEVGEPDYPPPQAVAKSLSESFKKGRYHYTETRGISELREKLAKKAGVRENRLIVTPGGRFGVFGAIVTLVKPGQELIVIEPAWPAYRESAEFIGARVRILRTRLEDLWHPDPKQLEDLISPATKMIILNYPNNPTGKVIDVKTTNRIVSLARDYGLFLLSDEVYADYTFRRKSQSLLEYNYEKSIVVSSFSKRYAMTGFRVGFCIANTDVIKKISKFQAAGITSVAEPMQYAALAAVGQDYSENIKIVKDRLDFIVHKLRQMSLRFMEPDGGMYVYPEVPYGDDISLVEKLLGKGVAIAPGSGFGESYRKFIRISACRPREELEKGLDVIAEVVEGRQHA